MLKSFTIYELTSKSLPGNLQFVFHNNNLSFDYLSHLGPVSLIVLVDSVDISPTSVAVHEHTLVLLVSVQIFAIKLSYFLTEADDTVVVLLVVWTNSHSVDSSLSRFDIHDCMPTAIVN